MVNLTRPKIKLRRKRPCENTQHRKTGGHRTKKAPGTEANQTDQAELQQGWPDGHSQHFRFRQGNERRENHDEPTDQRIKIARPMDQHTIRRHHPVLGRVKPALPAHPVTDHDKSQHTVRPQPNENILHVRANHHRFRGHSAKKHRKGQPKCQPRQRRDIPWCLIVGRNTSHHQSCLTQCALSARLAREKQAGAHRKSSGMIR